MYWSSTTVGNTELNRRKKHMEQEKGIQQVNQHTNEKMSRQENQQVQRPESVKSLVCVKNKRRQVDLGHSQPKTDYLPMSLEVGFSDHCRSAAGIFHLVPSHLVFTHQSERSKSIISHLDCCNRDKFSILNQYW